MLTPSSQSRPSAPTRVDTTHFSIAQASRILFRIPEPKRKGTTTTAAWAIYGRMSGTNPVTTTPGSIARLATDAVTLRPTIQNSASGRFICTRGSTSRAKNSAASTFGGWAIIPVKTIRSGRSRIPRIGAK